MGVRGLTTFVETFFEGYWEKYEPKGGLVFDGYSLFFTLFLESGIDWIHGGQYWLYRDLLLEFFHSLKSSDIQPIVIMDGVDYNREKEPTILKRMTETIEKMTMCLEDKGEPLYICLPMLVKEVFVETLKEIGVPLYVSDGEADPVTVAFANHYGCPVVANDSDYFMFNLEHGYIPLSRLNWTTQPVTADRYTLKAFNDTFEINTVQLSHAIPAILGNDYIESLTGMFIKEGIVSMIPKFRVSSLVRYVSKAESVDHLLQHITKTLDAGVDIAEMLCENIEKARDFYNVNTTLSKEDIMSESVFRSTKGKKIPWWVIQQYHQGQFEVNLMQVIVNGQSFFRAVTDDPGRPTAQLISRDIRQSIYSLVSPFLKEQTVSEIVRQRNTLVREDVIFSCSKTLPSLYNMNRFSRSKKISLFCEIVGIEPKIIECYENKWKLVVITALYWVRVCQPGRRLIETLVACFLFCSDLENPKHLELLSDLPTMERTPFWMDTLHLFSSFQCIYFDMMKLNNALQNPLTVVSMAFLFDGQFAQMYACTDNLQGIVDAELQASPLYGRLLETLTSPKS